MRLRGCFPTIVWGRPSLGSSRSILDLSIPIKPRRPKGSEHPRRTSLTTQVAYYYGTGRRKTAVARVRLLPGDGTIVINGKPLKEAFPRLVHQATILQPHRVTNSLNQYSVLAKVEGGGISGQAGAISHGLARALVR